MPETSSCSGLDPNTYEPDEDGFPREIVRAWVSDKHERVRKYAGISASVRRKYNGPGNAGATFIDLYSGPGRARVDDSGEIVDGSALVAWRESVARRAPFTEIHIADADSRLLRAAEHRLRQAGAPVMCEEGPATETVARIVRKLNPAALHVAFLDPYDLEALPFDVIERLASFERMDILVHVSSLDLRRNLHLYTARPGSRLDTFAPGWRDRVDAQTSNQNHLRGKILEHWRNLLIDRGMFCGESFVGIHGGNNQLLYWLAFAARHPLAHQFWEKIKDIEGARQVRLF